MTNANKQMHNVWRRTARTAISRQSRSIWFGQFVISRGKASAYLRPRDDDREETLSALLVLNAERRSQ